MINLTFPDGATRAYEPGVTAFDVAKSISPSLAKRTVAAAIDGIVSDLSDPLPGDAKIEFLTREDPRALGLIRHDAAHVLAEAVQTLYPGTQVTIGPVIDEGFYYDFFREQPFTPEDFVAIAPSPRKSGAARRRAPSSSGRARRSRSSSSTPSRPDRTSRSTGRATGSTSAAART